MRDADQALSQALGDSSSPLALQAFKVLTHLGDTFTLTALCLVVAILLGAVGHHRLALDWVVTMVGNGTINDGLKQLVGRARPSRPVGADIEAGFSFSSGRSSGITKACGTLAYLGVRLMPPRWHAGTLARASMAHGPHAGLHGWGQPGLSPGALPE